MAELNFGLLNPPGSQSIGNAFVQGMDQAQESRARDLQMQQSMRKGQIDELTYRKALDTESRLNKYYADIAANGGPKTAEEAEKAMINSGVPRIQETGANAQLLRLKNEQTLARFTAANPTSVAAPIAPVVAPAPGSFGADVADRTAANPFRTNMMPGAAAAPADGNNLIANLNRRIDANVALGTEQGYKQAEQLRKQVADLNKRFTVGNALMGGEGNIIGTAPRQPNLATDLMIPGPNGTMVPNTALIGVKRQLAQAGASNVKVNTFVPASEEAQKEFMKETRATYGTLKQSPAMFANIEAAKKLIPSASVFMGTGGEGMKAAASFLNSRLGMNINTTGVKDATELQSRLFQGIMDNLRKLDSQPSERQQAALQEALGSLSTDPNALPNVLDAFADSVRSKIDIHNAEVQSAISRGVKFPYDPIIKVPAKAAVGNMTTNPQYLGFSIGTQ